MTNLKTASGAKSHKVVSREKWLAERTALLQKEKELTRLNDDLVRQRQELPWVLIDKSYMFDTPDGKRSLADLFGDSHQLVVQHFMLAPGKQQGCKSCSYMADHTDGTLVHLKHRDTAFVAISRAPLPEIELFQKRMGWKFPWVSSFGNDFNRDFRVTFTADEVGGDKTGYNFGSGSAGEEMPGISVFYKDDMGAVFHAYSTYGRGVEVMMHTYKLLDLTPKGRDENGQNMAWVRHHDRYESGR
jgi:predicted dithiol-disulfide oxidoreductase (DUF899 family)